MGDGADDNKGERGTSRDFKTTAEHWKCIVTFFEENPELIRTKFSHSDGDSIQKKSKWKELTTQLNSLGYGTKSVQKWQETITRWRSKVKSKAALLKRQRVQTGGGPAATTPLTAVEERLMGIMGWKYVTGDDNVELGLPTTVAIPRNEVPPLVPLHPIATEPTPLPRPLDQNIPTTETGPPKKRKTMTQQPCTTRNVQTSIKTRRYTTMTTMHQETLYVLKNIDKRFAKLNETMGEIKEQFVQFTNCMMEKNFEHKESSD